MRRTATIITALSVLTLAAAGPAVAAGPGDDLTPRVPGKHSVVHREQAVIAASPGRIWDILADLPRYREWNPWVRQAEGRLEPGGRVDVTVVLGSHVMAAQHTVLVVEPQHRLCWRDAGWNAYFVYGQRCRTLEQRPDGTVLVTNELLLDGILSSSTDLLMGAALRQGLAGETGALKQRAERAS
ncbi:SRPBCC family protein [Streptomyces sp. NPDC127178]|uniref:SRPBCC family protein n=1 Tax=unclassified Streptomyces TaxID=2593676 RepID=UPI00362FD6E6